MAKKKSAPSNQICQNRKARHDYLILETFEAGLMLEGWEVKSARENRVQINEAHIIIRRNEAWLLNAHFTPLSTTSTHKIADPTHTRKLLLHRKELNTLMGRVEQKGLTIVPLSLYWKRNRVKAEIALAQGKKLHDKRAVDKDRDWQRQKERIMKR